MGNIFHCSYGSFAWLRAPLTTVPLIDLNVGRRSRKVSTPFAYVRPPRGRQVFLGIFLGSTNRFLIYLEQFERPPFNFERPSFNPVHLMTNRLDQRQQNRWKIFGEKTASKTVH